MKRLLPTRLAAALSSFVLSTVPALAQGPVAAPKIAIAPAAPPAAAQVSRATSFDGVGIPALFYTPDTRFGAGAAGILLMKVKDWNREARPSVIRLSAVYTTNRQSVIQLVPEIHFNEGRQTFHAEFAYLDYPDRFYGVGDHPRNGPFEMFTYAAKRARMVMAHNLSDQDMIGVLGQASYIDIPQSAGGGLLSAPGIHGNTGGRYLGVGLYLRSDYRDSIFYSRRGHYIELRSALYDKALGSDLDFTTVRLEGRKFWDLGGEQVLAAQALFYGAGGQAPFFELSNIGGATSLRGYRDGEFRDRLSLVGQLEYRRPVIGPVGMALFTGLGTVSESFTSWRNSPLLPSVGAGLRYNLHKAEHINLRADAAFGSGAFGLYVLIGESF